jgi:hypothetical protein
MEFSAMGGHFDEALARMLPFISAMGMREGRATAFVCHDFTCDEPATDAAGLAERLSRTIAVDN